MFLGLFSLVLLVLFVLQAVDADLDNDEEYLVDHSIVLYFVGPNGDFLEFYTQRTEVPDVLDRMEKQFQAAGVKAATVTKRA